jgi:negative regulator of flagellin synthesis FlgM
MTMKIDLNRSTQDTEAAKSTEAAQKVAEKRVAKKSDLPGAASTDRVEVSSDAKLLAAALKATTEAQPVRADVVEAMKQKLAAGEIGKDSGRLADRMIDDLLKE